MTDFLQLTVAGVALGCQYALVALGFIVIMKSSGLLSILQGGMVLLGAYLAFTGVNWWGLPFAISVVIAVAASAGINVLAEHQVIRRSKATAPLTSIFLTFGLLLILQPLVEATWGTETLNLGDPWGFDQVSVGGIGVTTRDVWTIGLSAAVLLVVYVLFNHTSLGLAMRAAASDPEAAMAQGIKPGVVQGVSWALAGGLAALAGILLATAVGGGVRPGLANVAFAALPAIYLGGVGSPVGAVLGALLIGTTQLWAAGYAPASFGQGFAAVFPFIVMVIVLLVRPQGLLGTSTAERA